MDTLCITDDNMEIHFNPENGMLKGFSYNCTDILLNTPFWKTELQLPDGLKWFSILDMHTFTHRMDKDTLHMYWNNELLTVHVTLTSNDGDVGWNIQVSSNQDECAIGQVVFPIIGTIPAISNNGQKDYLLLPWQNGWLIKDPVHTLLSNTEEIPFWLGRGNGKYENEYPAQYSFQFAAFYSPRHYGYYFSTQDGDAYIKTMGFYYDKVRDGFTFAITNYPEDMYGTSTYSMPYRFVMQFFTGDWQHAVGIYRPWAIQQKWCQHKLVDNRSYNNIQDIDLWRINHTYYNLGKRTGEFFNTSIFLKNELKCNLAVHWYGWNMGQHDINYPEYISKEQEDRGWPRELREWNDKFSEQGIIKIPYVNARMWDTHTESWQSENALSAALKDKNQEPYYEPWQGDRLKPMCPATQIWSDKVTSFSSIYIQEYNFDGIYLDQAASFNAMLCFDKNHNHPAGGGSWWNTAYHEIIASLRSRINPGKILTTESCCETYIDAFDLFLILDTNLQEAGFPEAAGGENCEPVPLFNMIYGDRAFSYGSICKFTQSLAVFEFNFIRNLLWGILPTIEGAEMRELTSEHAGDYLEVLRRGLAFFRENRELVLLGRPVEIPAYRCESMEIGWKIQGKEYYKEYPCVIAVKWEDPAANKTLFLYNFSEQEHTIVIDSCTILVSPKTFMSVDYEQEKPV